MARRNIKSKKTKSPPQNRSGTAPRPSLRILQMPETSWWESKRTLPRALVPFEFHRDPCEQCAGHCCRTYVGLTTYEASRMAHSLKVPLEDLVVREQAQPDRYTRQSLPIRTRDGVFQLRLRHQRERPGSCVFLVELGARGRCGAYALRPGVCRLYPYHLQIGEESVEVGDERKCPTGWLQDAARRRQARKDFQQWQHDLHQESELLSAWEQQDGANHTWDAFVRFAMEWSAPIFGADLRWLYPAPRRRLGERLARSDMD